MALSFFIGRGFYILDTWEGNCIFQSISFVAHKRFMKVSPHHTTPGEKNSFLRRGGGISPLRLGPRR